MEKTLNMIRLEGTKVYYENGVYIGDIFAKEDGFYDFWPALDKAGYWSSYLLKALAEQLEAMNAPYQKEIDDYLEAESKKEEEDRHAPYADW